MKECSRSDGCRDYSRIRRSNGWSAVATLQPLRCLADQAAFHFLTDSADQRPYLRVMNQALAPGGHAIVGTFVLDGPAFCSGLPVTRYDGALLYGRLGEGNG